jgi:preprotein translocase subunit YajC
MSLYPYPVIFAQEDARPGSGDSPDSGGDAPANEAPIEIISQPANGAPGSDGPTGTPGSGMIWILAIFFLFMWLLIIMPQRREKKKHAAMQSSLKKGDRVQSIGGIRGTIAELNDTEVVLKVDESNNTRMTFARSAIQGVVDGEKKQS